MYIFCFFSSILHNMGIFILKFEDNSMKEEELKEFNLNMTPYPNVEGPTGLEILVFSKTLIGSLSHSWSQLLTKIWSPIHSRSWNNKKTILEDEYF
jgi:hypothetical protein